MPVRDIVPDTLRPAMDFSITYPGAPPSGGPARLVRWSGRWRHVAYAGPTAAPAWKPLLFNAGVGLYTTGLADCYCVALVAGREIKYSGNYWGGSLGHLPGGDPSRMPWADFIAGTGYSPGEIVAWSRFSFYSAHLLIAGNDTHSTFYAENILESFRTVCAIEDRAVTFYRGGVANGFGVHSKGWFGVPTFGVTTAAAPIPADNW